jgi:hypothetical protein
VLRDLGTIPAPTTLQFLIVMIASAINERLQRKLDYVEDSAMAKVVYVDASGISSLSAGCALGLSMATVGTYAICSSHMTGSLTFRVDGTDAAGNVVQTGSATQSAVAYPPPLSISVAMPPP